MPIHTSSDTCQLQLEGQWCPTAQFADIALGCFTVAQLLPVGLFVNSLRNVHHAWLPEYFWVVMLQVMGLSGRVQAYALTSLTSKEETAQVMAALTAAASTSSSKGAAGKGKGSSSSAGAAAAPAAAGCAAVGSEPLLLYVTPEKIVASKRLMAKLEKLHQVGLLRAAYI
jgi:hypothetical protein